MVEGEQHDPGQLVHQSYVCGFMFSPDLKRVALIRKNRPDWQKGKLNGIGGKIEGKESALDAMYREFWEEAGIEEDAWDLRVTLDLSRGGSIYIFSMVSTRIDELRSMTDELVSVYDVKDLQLLGTMPNVQWIVPMLLSFTRGEKTGSFVVKEREVIDAAAASQKSSPMLCEHANENPSVCKCEQDCYCKSHTCKDK